MKRWMGAALLLMTAACVKDETDRTRTRLDCFPDRFGYSITERGGTHGQPQDPHRDTAVYAAGVEFPMGYDWTRDAAFGHSGAEIVLYKDGQPMLRLPSGTAEEISADADLHHLVDGHIYTEFAGNASTSVRKDGKKLFSYPGRELLCGLLVQGDDVYTLGQSRDGDGFALRKNGEVMFQRSDGHVSGHFATNPFFRSGALYEDCGHICFSYSRKGDGQTRWFICEDGVEMELSQPPSGMMVTDVRMIGGVTHTMLSGDAGRNCYLMKDGVCILMDGDGRGYDSRDCVVGMMDGTAAVWGRFGNSIKWKMGLWLDGRGFRSYEDGCMLIAGGDGYSVINPTPDTLILIDDDGRRKIAYGERWYFPSHLSGHMMGSKLVLGLTPYGTESHPSIWMDGKTVDTGMNGFLTAVEMVVD